MTRKDALNARPLTVKRDVDGDGISVFSRIKYEDTITSIFDDFESRICENCIYNEEHHGIPIQCVYYDRCKDSPKFEDKFKRKTNG